ncbi:hypothetical protein, partial [Staphylococcus aureus]
HANCIHAPSDSFHPPQVALPFNAGTDHLLPSYIHIIQSLYVPLLFQIFTTNLLDVLLYI